MQRVLVTGTNRGLGLEFVCQLLERGDRVFATCRRPDQAQALNKLAGAHADRLKVLPLDLTDADSIAAFVAELGKSTDALDVLINNAGLLVSGERFGELRAKTLNETFASNVTGPVLLTQALARLLEKGNNAKVMNLSSRMGSIDDCGGFGAPSYRISKAALNMATVQLAAALSPAGVSVFCIHPGWVQTGLGGANAPLQTEESVTAMLRVLDAASTADAGRFVDRNGETIAW